MFSDGIGNYNRERERERDWCFQGDVDESFLIISCIRISLGASDIETGNTGRC